MTTAEKEPGLFRAVQEFRKTLEACEELYRASALEYVKLHADWLKEPPDDFIARMIDLHRGLVLKTFVEIAQVDWKWSRGELVLARELFEHVWGRRLDAEQLRQALQHVVEDSKLSWDVLVGPFERLASLRDRAGRVQTLVMRLANLVAKADGVVKQDEVRQLQWIQAELRRSLERIPLSGPGEHERSDNLGRQAVQHMAAHAGEVRSQCELKTQKTVAMQTKSREEQLQDSLAELDELIGLANIKQEVRSLVNYLKMQQERQRLNLPQTKISLHSVFTGNPGTGKTTVARLLGGIFGAMGILTKGHLVETDRSGLVAEYAGQTGPKTNKRIDEALDGVLFIDEAYSLVAEEGDDPYGAEAVQALLKRMEDDRTRLIVILAGYPEPMDRLLKSNPGLSSRFNRSFRFLDYSAAELGRIFETMCQKNEYELPNRTRVKLLLGFQHLLDERDEHFGNGRRVRNLFEMAIGRLADRIAGVVPLTKELLTRLEPEDIIMDGVCPTTWENLDAAARRFRVTCPGCQHSSPLPQTHLGQNVQCKRCKHRFAADWGEVNDEAIK